MFGIENYTAFLLAGILLNITPGQDTVYIIGRSITQGRNAGIASALGIATGSVFHTIAAALGLSAVLSSSPVLFTCLKILGAIYLVYLGIQMINNSPKQEINHLLEPMSIYKIYRKGIITNILNPKVALFFLAFLPQFISEDHRSGILPFLILGITFIITGTIWCFVLAYSSSYISRRLRDNPKIKTVLDKICGFVFIGLGVKLFLSRK